MSRRGRGGRPSHSAHPDRHTGRGQTRRQSRARRRRRQGRRALLVSLLLAAAVTATYLVVTTPWESASPAAAADRQQASATRPTDAPPTPSPSPDVTASATSSTSPGASPTTRTTKSAPPVIPASGPGTFTVARAGASSGGGNAYRVEVEDGSHVDPDEAAARVADILAAPRGWAHNGEHTFRQVSEGPAGLVIKIATAATTDRICGEHHLDTHGEVNCRVDEVVMVNLKRWQTGSPKFDGPLDDYRALIINHEVGHWLGHGHETCPGKGRPAPAMMQQIYGLKGCVANAWPYDENGAYLGGPAVP
uniref:DUF3152 domain-containing protein n=1 Tax=unclassified Streptomyces TaxID=2593676 RepID=UPI001F5424BC|nr:MULTISPECIES: DUF3152 domain-containing protein [unclassified Streptomyces]